MVPRVVNVRSGESFDVYVGRDRDRAGRGKWGNPFIIGRDGDRDEVIEKYREWILDQSELMARVFSLRGKSLGCWCAPEACHADVLLELANAPDIQIGGVSMFREDEGASMTVPVKDELKDPVDSQMSLEDILGFFDRPATGAEALSDGEVRTQSLAWVNSVRADYDLEPYAEIPAGYRHSTTNCALANMTAGLGDGSCTIPESSGVRGLGGPSSGLPGISFTRDGEVRSIRQPPVVNEFIRRFDRGAFPDLDLGDIS